MSQEPGMERREGERRKVQARRCSPARRSGRRQRKRQHQVHVEHERRSGSDRRSTTGPGGRRRRRFDRRVGDRRQNEAAFSRREIGMIREIFSNPRAPIACPRCDQPLSIRTPVARNGSTLRDVTCSSCHRHVTIADYTIAQMLVIDDHALVRGALQKILASAGHEVIGVPDAEAGLESYREIPADVVLVDMLIPETDGLEFIRRCRKEFPDARIVALAGQRRYRAGDPLAMAKSLGPVTILREPFTQEQVLWVLDEALGVRGNAH